MAPDITFTPTHNGTRDDASTSAIPTTPTPYPKTLSPQIHSSETLNTPGNESQQYHQDYIASSPVFERQACPSPGNQVVFETSLKSPNVFMAASGESHANLQSSVIQGNDEGNLVSGAHFRGTLRKM